MVRNQAQLYMPLFQLTLGYPEEGTEKSEDNLTVPIMVPYLFYQKQPVKKVCSLQLNKAFIKT